MVCTSGSYMLYMYSKIFWICDLAGRLRGLSHVPGVLAPNLIPYHWHAALLYCYVPYWRVISYTLGREYRVVRNRYSRLLFTSEDRLCANLHVQEQSTNMTSQCQYLAFAWRHRSTVVTSQCEVRKGRPWRQLRNKRSMMVFGRLVCSRT